MVLHAEHQCPAAYRIGRAVGLDILDAGDMARIFHDDTGHH